MPDQSLTAGPVVVAYEFTRREYVATAFAVSRLSAPLRIITGVGAAMFAVDLVLTLAGGSGGGLLLSGLFILVWAAFCGVGIPLWRWRSDRLIRGRQTYTASEAGLRFTTEEADSTVAWSLYTRAVEYTTFFILFAGRRGGTPILKRGFAGRDDQDRFRRLVSGQLPLRYARR
jgi:hypothetical protein